jgi:hypothetical protein
MWITFGFFTASSSSISDSASEPSFGIATYIAFCQFFLSAMIRIPPHPEVTRVTKSGNSVPVTYQEFLSCYTLSSGNDGISFSNSNSILLQEQVEDFWEADELILP